MCRHGFESKKEMLIKEGLTTKEFKQVIFDLCDKEFTGQMGNESIISHKKDNGEIIKTTRFDILWNKLVKDENDNNQDFVGLTKDILTASYKFDDFYKDYTLEVIDTPTEIIIFLAYISSF